MKIYSLSAVALVAALLGPSLLIPIPDIENNLILNTDNGISKIKKGVKPLTVFSDTYSGTGYHSYGPYTIDVSGLPANSVFTISWQCYDVPNKFTLNTASASSTTERQGVASYSGPWTYYGLNSGNSGSLSINIGSSTSIQLSVETSNDTNPDRLNDSWACYY